MSYSLRRSERLMKSKQIVKNEIKCETSGQKSEPKIRQKFICEKCCQTNGSKGQTNGSKGQTKKCLNKNNSKHKLFFDSVLNKTLKVCVNCYKLLNRLNKTKDKSPKTSAEEYKRRYFSNCHSFAVSLVQLLNDSSAERLYCPNLKSSGNACACLQRYVIGVDDNLTEKQKRAQHLLDLLTKAKHLSQQKCYLSSNPRVGQKIGLGNGHKKSRDFETYVKNERNYLKTDLNFCEKAIQRVLYYSNNFLHKRLKTEGNGRQRVETQKPILIDINLLSKQLCCSNKCIDLSETHSQLLDSWRKRASVGQLEARRVVAEMLVPTQAVRRNCFKFISLVTGSSVRTISKVNDYLKSNAGNPEPVEHGLKKYWTKSDKKQNNPKNGSNLGEEVIQSSTNEGLVNQTQIISVINGGRHQTIAILSPQISFIGETTLQIPVSLSLANCPSI